MGDTCSVASGRRDLGARHRGSHGRDSSTRGRRQTQLHEGGAGHPCARSAGRQPAPHPHRPALRPRPVGGVLRRARPARARRQPGGRLGHPRRPDRGHHDRPRGGPDRATAGPRRRLRRRELDARGRTRRRQARLARRPRGGRPAQLRPDDARGGQPAGHRRPVRPAVRDQPGGDRPPGPRRHRTGWRRVRRQPDDRHAAGQPRQLRRRVPPAAITIWTGRTPWPRSIGRPTSTTRSPRGRPWRCSRP